MRSWCAAALIGSFAWFGCSVAYGQQAAPDANAAAPAVDASSPPAAAEAPPIAQPTLPPATSAGSASAGSAAAAAPAIGVDKSASKRRSAPQVGIAPGLPQTGTIVLATPLAEAVPAADAPHDGDWRFDFHGFLRAPLRVGFGNGDDSADAVDHGGKLHAPPRVPDGTFTDWRYTNNMPGPWAELRFQYGNKRVTGNVLVAAYNITEGGYRNLQAQLGIDQAFITIDESDLVPSRFGFIWNVGAFQNRYGAAGRYDAGKYETYLMGRTHIAGETLTGFYHLSDDLTVTVEHGVGVKFEPPPLVSGLPDPSPPYFP